MKHKSTKGLTNGDLPGKTKNGKKYLHPEAHQNHEDVFQTNKDKHQINLEPLYPNTQCKQTEDEILKRFQSKARCKSEAHIMKMDIRKRRSIIETMHMRLLEKSSSNNIVSLRKRELILARISIYIVFVMLICHSIRLIPNTYEMVQTYSQVSICNIYCILANTQLKGYWIFETNDFIGRIYLTYQRNIKLRSNSFKK